jgi:hypothetical protein
MPSNDPDDLPTREELAQRVRQLEEQQQSLPIGRRNVVVGLLALAGVPALAGRASAQAGGDRGSACEWVGDQNAAGYDLLGLAHTFLGEQSDTPADSDYGANEVAVYVKDDGNLYIRPNGGSEQQVSGVGGAGPWSDLGTDSDGGDNYGLPNTADNIDMQGDGGVRNADLVSADSATINGNTALEEGGISSSSATLGGGWVTPNADRPTIVIATLGAETDGTTRGQITIEVDESGGTTLDYVSRNRISEQAGSNARDVQGHTVYVPPGGSYQFVNDDDPTGTNAVNNAREITL